MANEPGPRELEADAVVLFMRGMYVHCMINLIVSRFMDAGQDLLVHLVA